MARCLPGDWAQVRHTHAHTPCLSLSLVCLTIRVRAEGQLGHNTVEDVNVPRRVVTLQTTPVAQVACGNFFTVALTTDGRVLTWGYQGVERRLGLGAEFSQTPDLIVRLPTLMRDLMGKHVVQISAGATHAAALTRDGEVYVWGGSSHGQLGIGVEGDEGYGVHRLNKRGRRFQQVKCGWVHTVAIALVTHDEELANIKKVNEEIINKNQQLEVRIEVEVDGEDKRKAI